MYTEKCGECNSILEAQTALGALKRLSFHIRKVHGITHKEYFIKHKLHNKIPLCACGCGMEVMIHKWKVCKFYKDHKNNIPVSVENRQKISRGLLKIDPKDRCILSIEQLKEAWKLFQTPDFPFSKLSKKYNTDFRVFKKYWEIFKVAESTEIKQYAGMHKTVWGRACGENNYTYQAIDKKLLQDIYFYIIGNEKIVTYSFLIDKFNLNVSPYVLKNRLLEQFGEEVLSYLNLGNSSQQEVNFGYILKYYFKDVQTQIRLNAKIYDFLIDNKLLIEYDGKYWHENRQKEDIAKENLARENGYKIYRVPESRKKDLTVLAEIAFILEGMWNEIGTNHTNSTRTL